MYCDSGELGGFCSPGYLCPQGSATPTAENCGNATVYCPSGSFAPQVVPDGHYSTPESASPLRRTSSQPCPAGLTCMEGWIVAASCSAHAARLPTAGSSWHAVDPAEDGSTFAVVWCDHDTSGGQWTVLHVATGADGEAAFVSDGTALPGHQGDSLLAQPYSLPLATKVLLAADATETLVWRSSSEWLLLTAAPLSADASDANGAFETPVLITAPAAGGTGTVVTATGFLGFRRGSVGSGGDFLGGTGRGFALAA